ncbi:MAG TPA: hypothetical protein VJB16_03080 [archaeon]|nr:hypothetical protein [archaeon]
MSSGSVLLIVLFLEKVKRWDGDSNPGEPKLTGLAIKAAIQEH